MNPQMLQQLIAAMGAGRGQPQANPGMAMSQPSQPSQAEMPMSNPAAPPTGAQMAPGGGQTLGPPKSPPGPLLAAAGMQPNPNDLGQTPMGLPQRQGDMGQPAAPTTDEPTTPIAPPIRQSIPPMPRTPLGALLMPGIISGGMPNGPAAS